MNTSHPAHVDVERDVRHTPKVTLLVTTGCPYCEDARSELAGRAARGLLDLDIVSVESAYGEVLQVTHRPAMFPLVLIDGERFSVGRLPRRKLDRALATRTAR